MSEYVKLEDIEAVLADKHMNRPLDSDRWVTGDIGKSIADLPTIDIVCCSECINNQRNTDETNYDWCLKYGYEVYDDDYCGYGTRKESEEE